MRRGPRNRIDPERRGVIVTIRLSRGIIELLDLMVDNRSEFIREATWEKLERKMDEKRTQSQDSET